MKADYCGTHSEQVRFRQGWYSSNNRPRCDSCKYSVLKATNTGVTAKCTLGNFATSPAACCNEFKQP